MTADICWDPATIASLQSSLLSTKLSTNQETFFPSHAYARGGIGNLISTGSARAGISRLPERTKAARSQADLCSTSGSSPSLACSRPTSRGTEAARPGTSGSSSSTTRGMRSSIQGFQQLRGSCARQGWGCLPGAGDTVSLAAAAAASVVVGPDAVGVPAVAKHEWERGVQHPYDFVATTRQTRSADIRSGSKWATLSLYEVDPWEVKRHMDIVGIVDQAHAQDTQAERNTERVRRFTWAMQQRETFRMQRQEVAARYAKAGLPQRKAYSATPARRATEPAQHIENSGNQRAVGPLAQTSVSALNSPRPRSGTSGSFDRAPSGRGELQAAPGASLSIPKASYPNVYSKRATQSDHLLDSPLETARRRLAEAARTKAAADVNHQMVDLDNFEQHLQGLMKRQLLLGAGAKDDSASLAPE